MRVENNPSTLTSQNIDQHIVTQTQKYSATLQPSPPKITNKNRVTYRKLSKDTSHHSHKSTDRNLYQSRYNDVFGKNKDDHKNSNYRRSRIHSIEYGELQPIFMTF